MTIVSDEPGHHAPRATLKRRGLTTAFWTVGAMTARRSMALVSNLIMTRLLLPEDFGLMSMAITVLIMAEMITDIGIRQSIIRSERGEDEQYLQITWSVQLVRSAAIAAMLLLLAVGIWAYGPDLAPAESVYADPTLPALIAVATVAVLIKGLTSTAVFRAERRLDIATLTMAQLVGHIVTIVIMVGTALTFGATVWVLLMGLILGQILETLASHIVFRDVRMRFVWDKPVAAELWQFGRWIIVSSMMAFIVNSGHRFIMGGFLDARTFGLYAIATLWLEAGLMVLDRLTGGPVLSAIAETLRERRDAIVHVFGQVRLALDGFLVVAFLSALLGAGLLMTLLYSPEYLGAAPLLAIMSLRYLAIRNRPLNSILVAEGRTGLAAIAMSLSAGAIVIGMPLGWHVLGLKGAVVAMALAPVAAIPVLVWGVKQQVPALPVRRDYLVGAAVLGAAAIVYGLVEV